MIYLLLEQSLEEFDTWKIKFFEDEQIMRILSSLTRSPKSAQEISIECNIPIASVYRKLHSLYDKQLLQRTGTINDGVKCKLYSNLEEVIRPNES